MKKSLKTVRIFSIWGGYNYWCHDLFLHGDIYYFCLNKQFMNPRQTNAFGGVGYAKISDHYWSNSTIIPSHHYGTSVFTKRDSENSFLFNCWQFHQTNRQENRLHCLATCLKPFECHLRNCFPTRYVLLFSQTEITRNVNRSWLKHDETQLTREHRNNTKIQLASDLKGYTPGERITWWWC